MNMSKQSRNGSNRSLIVDMKGIVKHFPGVTALDHADFRVERGEIHALLGENGAGKTTMMRILNGIYMPDQGEIYISGQKSSITSSREASKLGISMVYQHFTLIPALTVWENMALTIPSPKEPFLDMKYSTRLLLELGEKYGLEINPTAKVSDLSVGEKQRAEIIRALSQGPKILILDEPTSVLTPIEVERLFEVLHQIARQGISVIFISHKLGEVLEISDRITVLKKGKVTGNLLTKDATREELATLMVGRTVLFRINRPDVKIGDPLLNVENLTVKNEEGASIVNKVSFSVHGGEILGIAGVSGNGQRELAEALLGLREAKAGRVIICKKDVTNLPTKKIINAGAGMIPEDIQEMGIVRDWTLRDNLILELHSGCPFADAGPLRWLSIDIQVFRNEKEIDKFCDDAIEKFNIVAPNGYTLASNLSGGNLQKLMLAREIMRGTKVLIACQPTRGLDVGAAEYVRTCLLKHKERGNAILLISEDLDELKMLSDRIAVMYEGEILGILPPDTKVDKIGSLMGGTRDNSRET